MQFRAGVGKEGCCQVFPAGQGPACRVVAVLMWPGRGSVRVRCRGVGAV